MLSRRYALTEYPTRSGDPCSCPERIPGLDATICPTCKAAWKIPWKAPPPSAAAVFTGSLSDFAKVREAPAGRRVTASAQSTPSAPETKIEDVSFTYAITLKRPWPWAIAHLDKRVENRSWRCHLKPGDWLAIHAGRGFVFDDADWIAERFEVQVPDPADHPTGIVAVAQFLGNVTKSDSPWFFGPLGWQLGEVHVCAAAVECKGKQGLWKPETEIKNSVYQELLAPF